MIRNCHNCNFSWPLPPTHKELKRGVASSPILYCCHAAVVQQLVDGRYPRLTEVAREDEKLCGPSGKYWELVREVPAGYVVKEDLPKLTNVAKPVKTVSPQYGSPKRRKLYEVCQ